MQLLLIETISYLPGAKFELLIPTTSHAVGAIESITLDLNDI
ncbi:hypothetical protein Cal7507_5149 [Calothrix sp. PCC 7507]|nr:hypothetical protein Cal7507_5149 [Calothrix sp. PCC 7507]